jgi:hypothetical protein
MSDFAAFIEELKERHGNLSAVAAGIGMSVSAFSRGVARGTLNVENLLQLATFSGEPPSRVLALAGKGDVAQQIEALYGQATVSPAERQLLEDWSHLDDAERKAFRLLMQGRIADRKRKHA